MAEDFGEPIVSDEYEVEGEQKDNKIWIIIAVVVVVLCCCCVIAGTAGSWLWNNGDDLLQGSVYQFISLLA
jgi:hypothetical protein